MNNMQLARYEPYGELYLDANYHGLSLYQAQSQTFIASNSTTTNNNTSNQANQAFQISSNEEGFVCKLSPQLAAKLVVYATNLALLGLGIYAGNWIRSSLKFRFIWKKDMNGTQIFLFN